MYRPDLLEAFDSQLFDIATTITSKLKSTSNDGPGNRLTVASVIVQPLGVRPRTEQKTQVKRL